MCDGINARMRQEIDQYILRIFVRAERLDLTRYQISQIFGDAIGDPNLGGRLRDNSFSVKPGGKP